MNGARGEVALEIGGEVHTLCLTLGALAQIETAFGCRKLSELDARMRGAVCGGFAHGSAGYAGRR